MIEIHILAVLCGLLFCLILTAILNPATVPKDKTLKVHGRTPSTPTVKE